MTLPVDVIVDLHQDGVRVHLNSGDGEDLRITGPYGESVSIPPRQLPLLIDWLLIVDRLAAQRGQGHRPCVVATRTRAVTATIDFP